MTAWLARIDGYDPVAAAAVTLRASSVDDERVCHLDGQQWWPGLLDPPPLRYDLVDAAFSGWIDTPQSAMTLAVEPWPDLPRYTLADARIRLWTGTPGQPWEAWTQRFDGRVTSQPRILDGAATLNVAVDDRWLDVPLLSLYAGTGGAEGDAGLKGTAKPLAVGAPRFVPAKLIDATNLVFQLSAYGEVEDVEVAFERVLRFAASAGNHSTYAALVAASIAPGQWATAKAVGMVRHGAPPVPGGRFTYHVKGDKAGPDGWVRLPGQLIKRLALIAGGSGRFSEASLDALDSARPYNVSVFHADQLTARQAIQELAASVNAAAGVSWLSQLFVAPLPALPGSATVTLDNRGESLPPVARVEQIEMDAPFWRMGIEAERTWDVHAVSDVAFTAVLVDRGAYVGTETYREGHIVQDQGVSWLYVNPTPTGGNAPPTLPTSSNSWWKALDSRSGESAAVRGAYSGATTYAKNDVVTDQNVSWLYIHATPASGNAPPTLPTTSNSRWQLWDGKLGAIENEADVTAIVDGLSDIPIKTDYLGAAKTGELPRDEIYRHLKNGGAVTSGNSWTYTVKTGTVNGFTSASGAQSISGAGSITFPLSSLGSDEATVEIKVANGTYSRPKTVRLWKDKDPAPPSGGTTQESDTTLSSFSATTMSVVSDELDVTPDATGQVDLTASMDLNCNAAAGTHECFAIFHWWNGSAWVDVGTETASSPDIERSDLSEPPITATIQHGSISINTSKTGLTNGVATKFRLAARRSASAGTGTYTVAGSATATVV